MRGAAKRGCFGRRREGAGEHDAFGVGRTKTGVLTEDGLELREDVLAQFEDAFVCGERHRGIALMYPAPRGEMYDFVYSQRRASTGSDSAPRFAGAAIARTAEMVSTRSA